MSKVLEDLLSQLALERIEVGHFRGQSQDLGFGFDPDDIAMPEFDPPDTSDFSDGLNDMISGMEDLGDAEEETGEKAKKAKKANISKSR